MKVCFIVESGTDARLVEGLARRTDLTVLARAIPGGRVISQPVGVPVSVGSAGRLAFAWQVVRALRRSPCDVVLVQGYGVAALAANLATRRRRIPCWMLVCSPAAEYYAARRGAGYPFSRLALAGLHILGYLNGAIGRHFIVLSSHLGDVVRRYSAHAAVRVVPVYGVDGRRFRPDADRRAARRARGLPEGSHIIFSSSRVAPEKDSATLLRAFARLVHAGRDVYLLNRSGGFLEFLEQARRAGVVQRVIATEAVDPRAELRLDYVAADVCVQASRAEGLGFSVLESLACETPVVASAVGGLVETVQDGVTGWSVPPGDADALAAALCDALDHPDEGLRRARAGAALVRERYDSEAVMDRLVAVLGGSAAQRHAATSAAGGAEWREGVL